MGKKLKPKKKRRRHKKSTKPSSSSDESEQFLTSSSSDESEEEIIQNEDGDQGKEGEKIENKDDGEFAGTGEDDDQGKVGEKIEGKDDGKFAEAHEDDDEGKVGKKMEGKDDGKFPEAQEDDDQGKVREKIEGKDDGKFGEAHEDDDQGKAVEEIEDKDDGKLAEAHEDDDQGKVGEKIEGKDYEKFAEAQEDDDQGMAVKEIEDKHDGKFAAHEDDVQDKAGENYTQIEVVREHSPFKYEVDYVEGDVDEETFYQGKIIFEDGLERKVSFVPYSDIGTVNLIYTQTLMVSDERIVRPWFYTFCKKMGKYLICYDHFETFVSNWIPPWKKEGKSIKDHDHLGDRRVLTEIRELAETIKHMHQCNVSHKGLDKTSNYVVAGDKVKIIRIQHSLEGLTEHQRSLIMTSHFKSFGTFLKESYLEPDISWSERDSFLKFFKYTVRYKKFVRLIIGHPFLEKRAEENMQYFSRIWLNFKSDTFRTGLLEQSLQASSSLYAEYVAGKKDGWFKSDMSAEFLKIYKYKVDSAADKIEDPAADKIEDPATDKIEDPATDKIEDPKGSPEASAAKYCHKNLSDLLRFIRNVYEHHYEYHLSLQTVYAEIRRLWPNLLDRLHEKNVK